MNIGDKVIDKEGNIFSYSGDDENGWVRIQNKNTSDWIGLGSLEREFKILPKPVQFLLSPFCPEWVSCVTIDKDGAFIWEEEPVFQDNKYQIDDDIIMQVPFNREDFKGRTIYHKDLREFKNPNNEEIKKMEGLLSKVKGLECEIKEEIERLNNGSN